ncbi:butyrophilin subfamily 3 member A2-like [Chelmon rostratus]|uniref:butyrophilin subfamily 3 member A2-like n=1 Tax=Chelmon rostratus TaxID=109905 RepID=UPI001BE61531|nr:butyrophilin subfamily 3 member A2-like [Chelmon rostratus]
MIHMKFRLVLKLQLGVLLHRSVVLLLLLHSCGGQSQVTDTSQPLVSTVGDDIILPCHMEPAVDASDLTVEWARSDLDPTFVHLRRDGEELLPEEHPLYRGRTSLSINKLKCGDVSLKLSKVKLSDEGTYRCRVPPSSAESVVKLSVGSVSSPEIKISKVSNGVKLECKSEGWYPQPEVFWLDAEGKLLPAEPAEAVRGPDGLYTVSSRVTVEKRHNTFTCRVHQKNISQTRETHIHVPVDLFMVQSSSSVRISICSAVCFLFIVACFFLLWKGRRDKIKTERSRLAENEKKYLEKVKAKLLEESQKNERESQHVREVIEVLTEQKENLKNQREKLISLQKEDLIQEAELEQKRRDNKMFRSDISTQIENTKQRATEHVELLKNTETQLETTEDLIIRMKERKAELDKDQEQIKKHLEETERQIEEIQRKPKTEQ